jgi:3-oxoacyl-[acyl-carrier-protein] synthase II
MNKVVVTGLGLVSPIGLNVTDFWENLIKGVSGIRKVKSFDLSHFPFERDAGGEVPDFHIENFYDDEFPKKIGRSAQMSMVACEECLRDSKYDYQSEPFRIGIAFGTTIGESHELSKINDVWYKGFSNPVPGQACDNYFYYKTPQYLAKKFKLYGPNLMIPNACSAGNFSIAYALNYIQNGIVDAMLVGGSDCFNRTLYAGFCRLGAVSPDVPRPFSENREGMIPAEGAGALLIESYESAMKRGAKIYAEVAGYGYSNDGFHITQGDPKGVMLAYSRALANAGIAPEDVSYISVHGTGTKANDFTETQALKMIFKEHLKDIPLSSVKSLIGHSMGAASAIEAIVSVLCIRDNVVPATANFTTLDPECEGIDPVPNQARKHTVNVVFETASGFGGNNCVLLFRRI